MPVQDVYTANLSTPSIGDKLSDKWLGTSKVAMKQNQNAYEMNKAYTINQYEWNKQGMTAAGINPLINESGLNNGVSGGDATGQMNPDAGGLVNTGTEAIKNLLGFYVDTINPKEWEKKAQQVARLLV